jgi:uncharacterized lipoprotein YehR (DUF1307 family)
MDKLEKTILENRAQFDAPRHPEQGWEKLRRKLERKESPMGWVWKVAAAIFFVSTLALGYINLSIRQDLQARENGTKGPTYIEDFYLQQISMKKQEYSRISSKDEQEEFFSDLAELDNGYKELKQSFEKMNGHDELAEAMLLNLRMRVMILNQQIEILRNKGDGETRLEEA